MASHLQVSAIALMVMVVLIIGVVAYRIRRNRRVATQDEIVVYVMSEWKGVALLLSWMALAIPLCLVLARICRAEAADTAALTLALTFGVGTCAVGFLLCLRLTRAWRCEGSLRCTPDRLSLTIDGQQWSLDLRQQFELFEWSYSGPGEGSALQAVVFRQGETVWGFTYPLAMMGTQFENTLPVSAPRPMVGPDAKAIHERVRAWSPSGGRAWL